MMLFYSIRRSQLLFIAGCVALAVSCNGNCADLDPTLQDLRREIDGLRKQITARSDDPVQQRIAAGVEQRFSGPAPVTTRSGKLKIGGLLQIWAYSIQNDTLGFLDIDQIDPGGGGTSARNEEADNDSFRVRRAEISFELDIHENISAYVMLDAARDATGYPSFPQNQGSRITGDHDAVYVNSCLCAGFLDDPRQIGAGAGTANRILQDAYLNFHGVVPHHDFSLGQMKRQLGEEGNRDSAQLDFAERAMITQPANLRDTGALVHGSFLESRVQYWLGVFNGAGTAFQSRSNRSDDNDEKDGLFSVYAAPLKNHESFGTLELGYSLLYGEGGESAGHLPGTNPVNGLNRRNTVHGMQYAWVSYSPGGPVRGWWMRGEWGHIRDRFAPSEATSGLDVISTDPAPFNVEGWYVSTGYKLGESACDGVPSAMRKLEFAFRYEVMENIFFHDLVAPERRFDVFKTQVITVGLNYYLMGNRAKLQLNHNWVREEQEVDRDDRQLRAVRNNSILVNFQVAF